ncbi:MAG: hypothetical protein WC201_00060 [Bacilli bacterium]
MCKKDFKYLIMLSIFFLALTACDGKQNPDGPDGPVNPIDYTIDTPILRLNSSRDGLVWDEVENADGYMLSLNGGAYSEAENYSFASINGHYQISVYAKAAIGYDDSEAVSYTYDVRSLSYGEISRSGVDYSLYAWEQDFISCDTEFSSTGVHNEEAFASNTSLTFHAETSGQLAIRMYGGFNEADHIYYPEISQTSYINIAMNSVEARSVLNGSETDLIDYFDIRYFNGSSEVMTANVNVTRESIDVEGLSEAINFRFNDGNYYKFMTDISSPISRYESISFYAKGNGKTNMAVQFVSSEFYVSYNLGVLSTNWSYINLPFDDDGWKVNGTSSTLKEVVEKQGSQYGIMDVSEVVSFLPTLAIVYKSVNGNPLWTSTNCYVAQINLAKNINPVNRQIFDLENIYSGKSSDNTNVRLDKTDETTISLSTLNLASNTSLDMEVEKTTEGYTFISASDYGASLTMVMRASRSGELLSFVSASGTMSTHYNGLSFETISVIDDFESYASTGIGYDKNNTNKEARSELRGEYLSEYYVAGSKSELLNDEWSLMGSTDYINLINSDAHSGTNAMRVKNSSNAMRHTTWGVFSGEAEPWKAASHFSFFMKNTSTTPVLLYFRLFTSKKVDNSVFNGTTKVQINVSASSDWTQYIIDIDNSKTYYGYTMTVEKVSGSTIYPLMDDIALFGDVNPWGVN